MEDLTGANEYYQKGCFLDKLIYLTKAEKRDPDMKIRGRQCQPGKVISIGGWDLGMGISLFIESNQGQVSKYVDQMHPWTVSLIMLPADWMETEEKK